MSHRPVEPRLPQPYGTMTAQELDAEVAKFDRPFIADQSRPMTRSEAARERRARRKRGRPRIGKGAQRVLITIERGLLRDTDEYARTSGLSRSQVIARGLRGVLAGAA
jgi:hypothetical protein